MSSRCFALGIVGLMLLAQSATAGPIAFSYVVTTTLDAGTPTPGEITFQLPSDGTLQFPEAGGSIAIGSIRLGDSPGPLATGATDSYVAFSNYRIAVAIDDGTGGTGTVNMYGGASDWWDYRSWDGRWSNTTHHLELGDPYLGNTYTVTKLIGENLFYLRAITKDGETAADLFLGVTPDPEGAPEPGTLILGAMALLPLAAHRLGRRRI